MSTVSVQSKKKLVGLVALVGIAAVLAVLFMSKQASSVEVPPVSEDGIPLPFGGASSVLQGAAVDVGTKNGNKVRYVTFSGYEKDAILQGPTHEPRLDFVVTPDSVSENAPFSLVMTQGKNFRGYEYTSRDAAIEISNRDEMLAYPGNAYTLSDLFPGRFFASDNSLSGMNVPVTPLSDMRLKKNTRYVFMVTSPNTVFTARDIKWCGDGTKQAPNSKGDTEACDDGNTVDTDSCSNTCTANSSPWYNASKPMDVNKDGKVDPTDSAAITSYLNAAPASASKPVGTSATSPSYDVTNDWLVSTADISVINNAILSFGYCGDGIKHNLPNASGDTEECDDGNTVNTDKCTNSCDQNNSAWFNVANPYDVTNDGMVGTSDFDAIINRINAFGTSLPLSGSGPPYYDVNSDWVITSADTGMITNYKNSGNLFCGNGNVEAENGGEQCDDGNTVNTDMCSNVCTKNNSAWYNVSKPMDVTGDGVIAQNDIDTITARLSQGASFPVNATAAAPPYLDVNNDGMVSNADYMIIVNYKNVTSNPFCPNGTPQTTNGEQCDDGNTVNTDMCSNTCTKNNSAWYNASNKFDVTNDGMIGTEDIQKIINRINTWGSTLTGSGGPPYYDVNNDGRVTSADSKMITDYNIIDHGIFCGNGKIEDENGGEVCDDGNTDDTDGCRNNCTQPPIPPL